MLLSHKTTIRLTQEQSNIIGHMCYAAYKLWNVGNYERMNYKELRIPEYPDWYYQKKHHKEDLRYRQLPSQTAQEVLKLLDKAWKSFYSLQRTHGIENPNPPRFKHSPVGITYMQNGIRHEAGTDSVRLSLPKQLKEYMTEKYDIRDKYLNLKNKIFKSTDIIKQIRIYPPEKEKSEIIVIYEREDVRLLPDNGRHLSIDFGLHNLMTCYDGNTGETFIVGRKYLSICHYYNKEIARIQSQWWSAQYRKGIKHPKSSGHLRRLYKKKNHAVNDYLHKITRNIVRYCEERGINTVIAGDITNIRKGKDLGHVTNQKLHALPYAKMYRMLEYKLAMSGIRFVKQDEAYSSQTSPFAERVSKEHAKKSNRVERGLYKDAGHTWNADCVGAFNILRLYVLSKGYEIAPDPNEIKPPYVVKVAV